MRIKMLVSQAGPSISRRARCVYDLKDDAEAQRLIDSGAAVATDEPLSVTEVLTTEPVVETPAAEEAASEPAGETNAAADETVDESEPVADAEPMIHPTAKKPKKRGK